MDVRCERCSTEYEFDDALVSGRGTTVKCTSCGHKFKIRRRDGDFSEDFWNVRTADGRTLVFTSLRELQRAIQSSLVERGDMLSRGGLPPKPIGQIPELSPFFDARDGGAQPRTEAPSGSVRSSRPPPPPGSVPPHLAAPVRKRQSTRPDYPPEAVRPSPVPARPSPAPTAGQVQPGVPSMKKTLHGTGPDPAESAPAPPAMRARMASVPAPVDPDPPQVARVEEPAKVDVHVHVHAAPPTAPAVPAPAVSVAPLGDPPAARAAPEQEALGLELSSPLPPPTAPVRRLDFQEGDEPSENFEPYDRGEVRPPRRRSVGGFVVAVVVLGGVALLGAVWARDHLPAFGGAKPQPAAADPRVAAFLSSGERALSEGNLDLAKESFDKASALAEKDPRVLLDVARLAAVRADSAWLKSRLLPAEAADEQKATREALAELAATARKAADDAIAVAPDDAAAVRARVDALRISGEREAARAQASKVAASASLPESAYVLAALDLAEPEPLWPTLIDRLRVAASGEVGPGRARAALVYALGRAGDGAAAKAEVERLASMSRQHALLPLLRAYAERSSSAKADKADAGVHDASVVAAEDPKAPKREGRVASNDPRVLVAQGEHARAKGDFDKAQLLYAAALDRNANDTEALSGLAAIAHARHDLSGARASYRRVLSINPSYVPALVGVGDVDWESGDRASAMKAYKEIVDRFPEGSYPPRVRQRLDAGGGAAPAPTPAPSVDPGGGG